jgi:hypothetical protein
VHESMARTAPTALPIAGQFVTFQSDTAFLHRQG